MAVALNPKQRELARHALGLTGSCRMSYRNYFSTGAGCADHVAWNEMVELGAAVAHRAVKMCAGDDVFCLTRLGAETVLNRGEKLSSEDFPEPRS